MNRIVTILLSLGIFATSCPAEAPTRKGSVEWSDGKKISGDLSLSPGKDFRLFVDSEQISVRLEDLKEIRFIPEKEEMREGFIFPEPGKAAKQKTGDVYPVRYFKARLTLTNGKILEGHLFTTVLYLESEDSTQKVVLLAKMSGKDGQKITDIVYPSDIRFDSSSSPESSSLIDLSDVPLPDIQKIVAFTIPDLTPLQADPAPGKKNIWRVPFGDVSRILYILICKDGLHAAWPSQTNPEIQKAIQSALDVMEDFYDTREIRACYTDEANGDVYTLILFKRMGQTHSFSEDKKPWSFSVLRWKYDPDEKKATLLNRVRLEGGRIEGHETFPTVFLDADLLKQIHPDTPPPTKDAP